MMHTINLQHGDDLFAHLRALVEAGAEDGPFTVLRYGQPSVSGNSLHGCALVVVVEEPRLRFARYTPHYKATIGPRMAALIEADTRRRQEKKGRAA